MEARPFVKWVGGKGKLIPEISRLMPDRFNRYFEPFVGGGAVFFSVINRNNVTYSSINDINRKLITAYEQIKHNPKELISLLKSTEEEYKKLASEEQKQYFYDKRSEYNKNILSEVQTASCLIFLNKTCFNGMYRENSKGHYNIPFGDQKNPTICDAENIMAVSKALQKTDITNQSFETSVEDCQKGDLIYFDPPYYPVNTTSNFTSYSKDSFGIRDQEKLRDIFIDLDKKGCFVMLSNSHTPFIEELYKNYRINLIFAARSINSKATGRGKVKEVLVSNF